MKKLILFLLFVSNFSFAAIEVIPSVGLMTLGNLECDKCNVDASMKGMDFSLRVGYDVDIFLAGMEFGASFLSSVDDGDDIENPNSRLGVTGGLKFSEELRLLLAYYFHFKSTLEYDSGDVELNNGSGFGMGIGYFYMKQFYINVELRYITGDEVKSGSAQDYDWSINPIFVSISFPLHF